MIFLGVDPGLGGALCAYYCAGNEGPAFIADCIDMPITEDGIKNQVDIAEVCKFLDVTRPKLAIVENVQPMPSIPDKSGKRRSMGATSSFRFGMAVGQIRGALIARRIPIYLLHSTTWTRYYGLKGGDKEPHRQLAIKKFPGAGHYLKRKKDDGRADAMLIADWGHDHRSQIFEALYADA